MWDCRKQVLNGFYIEFNLMPTLKINANIIDSQGQRIQIDGWDSV